jgi:hypothetical protein
LTHVTGSRPTATQPAHPDRTIGERRRDLHRALAAVDQSSYRLIGAVEMTGRDDSADDAAATAPTWGFTEVIIGSRTATDTASTAAQRHSRNPCLVMLPHWIWVSDWRWRGVSRGQGHRCPALCKR